MSVFFNIFTPREAINVVAPSTQQEEQDVLVERMDQVGEVGEVGQVACHHVSKKIETPLTAGGPWQKRTTSRVEAVSSCLRF